MKATLSLTHKCNLSCRYCYAGNSRKQDMSLSTAKRIVDFVNGIAPPGRNIEFSFFGGEPLLCFDLIQQVVGYIRELQQETGRPITLSITSNGTLLTPPMLDFFGREGVDLCISIDGPAPVHDRNRRFKNGRGSFAPAVTGLKLALDQLRAVQVNAVYGPDTLDALPETIDLLSELGVSVIHLNPNITAGWTEDVYASLPDIFMRIAEQYIQSYQSGQELAINFIDGKVVLFLSDGYRPEDMCGMGETEWGFAPSGNIYPCERFIGEDNDLSLCLGNVHTSLDLDRRCTLLASRGNRNAECAACALSKYCMNWCGCTNHYMTGRTDLAAPMLCTLERAAIRAGEHVLITLSQLDNELFIDHLMRYLCEGRRFR